MHLKRITWALRKARLPVNSSALVLDVGSGGNPYVRADVLIDRLEGGEHRCGAAMVIDRPTIFGDAMHLPFKDKAFDFIVASHILEHMPDPSRFLSELQRVGKAGYIETPNFLFERMHPYEIHCLEVAMTNNRLVIHKKSKPIEDNYMGSLDYLKKDKIWSKLFFERLELFHVRYYWKDKIDYLIVNPEISCDWIESVYKNSSTKASVEGYGPASKGWRGAGLRILAGIEKFRRRKRLQAFDLSSILACPACKGDLIAYPGKYQCSACKVNYSNVGIPNFCT